MKTTETLQNDWLLATEMHKLAARIWHIVREDGVKVIMVSSATRGEGKSTTVAYLSTVLANYPTREILAVDLDFRVPSLARHLGIEEVGDLGALLRGAPDSRSAILRTDLPNLSVALPRPEGDDPNLLLKTHELTEMFRFFRETYDLVLVDAPALVPVADASLLIPFCDGIVLSVMAGRTTKPDLNKARELCLGIGGNILGLVIGNMKEADPRSGGAGYYSYYGKREKETDNPFEADAP